MIQKRKHFLNTRTVHRNKSFALVEALVVVGIFTLLTSTVLLRHDAFDSSVNHTILAYSVAFLLREAQVYGTSVRSEGGEFGGGYGVYFEQAEPTIYRVFIAEDESDLYDGSQEIVETYQLGQGHEISDICARVGNNGNIQCDYDTMDFIFKRPDPGAHIYRNAQLSSQKYEGIILLEAPNGNIKEIHVYENGQIRVSDETTS